MFWALGGGFRWEKGGCIDLMSVRYVVVSTVSVLDVENENLNSRRRNHEYSSDKVVLVAALPLLTRLY